LYSVFNITSEIVLFVVLVNISSPSIAVLSIWLLLTSTSSLFSIYPKAKADIIALHFDTGAVGWCQPFHLLKLGVNLKGPFVVLTLHYTYTSFFFFMFWSAFFFFCKKAAFTDAHIARTRYRRVAAFLMKGQNISNCTPIFLPESYQCSFRQMMNDVYLYFINIFS